MITQTNPIDVASIYTHWTNHFLKLGPTARAYIPCESRVALIVLEVCSLEVHAQSLANCGFQYALTALRDSICGALQPRSQFVISVSIPWAGGLRSESLQSRGLPFSISFGSRYAQIGKGIYNPAV